MAHRTFPRMLVVGTLIAGGQVASTAPARADFHLMEVQEVSAGTVAQPNADFVELQMTFAGQGNVSGHKLLLFDAAGGRTDCTLPGDVANAALGDPILLGTTEFQALAPPDPDFIVPPALHSDGGAVCWESIDCVSWGTFGGQTTSPAGTPKAGGIPPDQSIDRVADTNNSNSDFTANVTPTPDPNGASTQGTATCATPGPGGGGGGAGATVKGLKAKVKGNRATITGQIQPPDPGKRVSLTFFANGSPLQKVAKRSATLNSDSKFKKSFGVPTDSTKCKVKVAFQGATLGQKKFAC